MAKDFIMIESDAFRAIMNKIDKIDNFIREREEAEKKRIQKEIKLYTSEEVIKIFRISKQTLWRMRDRGDIEYSKHGNTCLYTQKEIDRILNQKIIRYRRKNIQD